MKCDFFCFTHQQSESLFARDVVGRPRDMPCSFLLRSHQNQNHNLPSPVSEQGDGPVVMAGELSGSVKRGNRVYHFMVRSWGFVLSNSWGSYSSGNFT